MLFRSYAHQGGSNPPRIVIHGNALEKVPDSYRRFLEHFFRDIFKLEGTPLKVEFKSASTNPFERKRRPNANWAGGGMNDRS